jgi:hypothetical protein
MKNVATIELKEHQDIHAELSYSSSLETAVRLLLGDPVAVGDGETFSLRFIRAARFLKANAPHVFHIREMHAKVRNRMDRWLWDFLG